MLALGRGRWAVSQKAQLIHLKKNGNFLCLSSPSVFLALQDGRLCPGGDTPRISCGGVPPESSNPDPISDHKM